MAFSYCQETILYRYVIFSSRSRMILDDTDHKSQPQSPIVDSHYSKMQFAATIAGNYFLFVTGFPSLFDPLAKA